MAQRKFIYFGREGRHEKRDEARYEEGEAERAGDL